jgi:Fe2+ or Zn2+ uptake regulation protein
VILAKHSLETILKKHKKSLTSQRKSVFDALSRAESLSMNELIRQLPSIDRASVYRTVELFEKLDVIHKIQIGWKYKIELSDMFRSHHHHAVCSNCSRAFPLKESPALERQINDAGIQLGFQVTSHSLELRGLCQDCSYK